MLTCIFHPIDTMQVVEEDVADRMRATGVWFDTPQAAKAYRDRVEDEIKAEPVEQVQAKPKRKRG